MDETPYKCPYCKFCDKDKDVLIALYKQSDVEDYQTKGGILCCLVHHKKMSIPDIGKDID